MDDDILSKVVEVEKEVQQRLEIEKKMSQEWLEKAERDAEEKVLAEEAEIKEAFNFALKNAKLNAEEKTASIIKNANEEAERLQALGDEIFKKILLKHISIILPGT
jgi:vacuolar-type H+-ATPase subunit H